MSALSLSEAERTFIIHGVQDDLRADGRHRDDFRHLELETGVVSNTNGSCRLRLGETDLLIGVKAELGEPHPATPRRGRLEFFVDCSANAAPEFEGRGGDQLASEISNVLYNSVCGVGTLGEYVGMSRVAYNFIMGRCANANLRNVKRTNIPISSFALFMSSLSLPIGLDQIRRSCA